MLRDPIYFVRIILRRLPMHRDRTCDRESEANHVLSVIQLMILVRRFRLCDRFFIVFAQRFFKSTDRFPEPFSKFREFLWAEDDKGNQENYQKVSRLKETFKHIYASYPCFWILFSRES